MKFIKTEICLLFVIMLLLLLVANSCKRDSFSTVPLASLKIGNYVTGGTTAKLRGVYSTTIANNANSNFGALPGSQDFYIYPIEDSLHPYYYGNHKEVLDAKQSYTLFLGGTPSDIRTLFIPENWPQPDSNIRVRILHFSPGGPAITITLSTSPDVAEFSPIEFGQVTGFKAYTKKKPAPAYLFQVRNSATNAVLSTHTLSSTLVASYNNFTLVFRGIVNGSPAAGVSRVLHN